MPRIRSSLSVFVVSTLSLSALVAAQISPVPSAQSRDTVAPSQPTERRIPVGNSSISGVVVTSDTGRPVRGARVTVNGQVTTSAPAGASAEVVMIGRGGQQVTGVAGPQGLSRTVVTDANGEFTFPRLPAGQFTISVYQNQFLQFNYGQRKPGSQGTPVALAEGQQLKLNVPMIRGAVITGIVLGPDGEPQRGAQVRGWRYDMSSGFRRLQSAGYAQTDDRGIYRLFSLQPGDYLVSATPNQSEMVSAGMMTQAELTERAIASGQVIPPVRPGLPATIAVPVLPPPAPGSQQFVQPPAYLATYAPSSMVPSGGTMVTVAGADERSGVDIHAQLTLSSNVQGIVSTPLDTGVTVQVTLMSDDATIDSPQGNSTRPDAGGKFTFRAVSPGKYTVMAVTVAAPPPMTIINGQPVQPQPQAQPVLTDAQKMWGKAQINVAGEPTVEVIVALQPARSISGIVVFNMAKPPDLSRARLMVMANTAPSPQQIYSGPQPQGQVGPDGRFTLTGVAPGRYIVRVGGGQLKSSVIGGQDTLDFPLEFTGERDVTDAVLTLADQTSELAGTLTDTLGKPATSYMVIVAATDHRYWMPGARRIAMTKPGADGRYVFRGLPPGMYHLAAVIDLEPGAHYDPEFLKSVARASVPVTIADASKVTQDMRVK